MSESETPEVIVLGAICLDVKARILSPEVPGSFNPAQISISAGGSGRNISENLARLGVRVTLLSVVGEDILGQELLDQTARTGVELSRVIRSPGRSSGINVSIFGIDDDRTHALDDWSQLKAATPRYINAQEELFRHARMLILDGTADTETIAAAIGLANRHHVPVYTDPAAVRRAFALRPYLSEFTVITPNVLEAEALLDVSIQGPDDAFKAARQMVSAGVKLAVITMGEQGLVYVTSEGPTESYGRIPAIRSEVVDRTGVGDAQSAAIVYGLINDMPVDECLRLGVAAATLTLRCPQSVCPDMSLEQLYANMVI